jgi:hypothetical protein
LVTTIEVDPLAESVASLPVMVTVPVVPPMVPVPELGTVMLMIAELLEVSVVFAVTLVPFSVAVKVTVVPIGALVRLIGLAGLDVMMRFEDAPAVTVTFPVITVPLEDCSAA